MQAKRNTCQLVKTPSTIELLPAVFHHSCASTLHEQINNSIVLSLFQSPCSTHLLFSLSPLCSSLQPHSPLSCLPLSLCSICKV